MNKSDEAEGRILEAIDRFCATSRWGQWERLDDECGRYTRHYRRGRWTKKFFGPPTPNMIVPYDYGRHHLEIDYSRETAEKTLDGLISGVDSPCCKNVRWAWANARDSTSPQIAGWEDLKRELLAGSVHGARTVVFNQDASAALTIANSEDIEEAKKQRGDC